MSTWHKLTRLLLWTEVWVVAAAVLAGMLWAPALSAAPLAGLVYALLHLALRKRLPGPTPADLAILLLGLILAVNYTTAAVPALAGPASLRLLGGIALYYAVVHWCRTSTRLRGLAALSALAAAGLSLLSLVAVEWTSGKLFFIPQAVYARFTLLVSDTIHPNVMGGSLAALLPLALGVPLFAWRRLTGVERLLYPLAFLVALGALVLTQSRGALLAAMAALGILLLFRSRWFWALPALAVLAIVSAGFILGPGELQTRALDIISVEGFGQRADIWQHTLYLLQDFPLTGVGMGHFPQAFALLYPLSLAPAARMLPHAHNLFLQVAADLGLPGLVAWSSVLLASLAATWQAFQSGLRLGRPRLRAISIGLFGCQAAVLLHGLLDAVLWGDIRPAPLVWWLWGLGMAALNITRRLSQERFRAQ